MDIHSKLFDLYTSQLEEFKKINNQCSGILQGPFLCSPGKKYLESAKKIIFVGQETNGWPSNFDVEYQMKAYSEFDLGANYFSSPFWNVIRKIEKAISNDHYCSAWLNLNKFDENNKSPSAANLAILEKLDYILLKEIEFLSPDIVILFTGPKYDNRVTNLFNQVPQEIEGFNTRHLAEVRLVNRQFKIYRTYHPNYLRRSGLESKIIQAISLKANL
ncbi:MULTISPECIES: hypothetical protein [Deefgea]|uniref:Uracil-DNA glycosylase-like domain-containing protein n=1 Tax=Deefgea chitinilytica TaxID=570276 RepID=A0ABS2CDI9_9NEIS|nr:MULTISPECIES: hypothetical protein [Deefgea]MBM5572092.1 hypothetical protein [Deefgea chitinilytica]MBM9889327.1 hypothetical protein [Deefgea sp. CFH1-16]